MGKALKTVGVIIGAAALIATGVGALAMPALAGTTTLFGVSVPWAKGLRWKTEADGLKTLKALGFANLIEALDSLDLARIAPAMAHTADIVALPTTHKLGALAICMKDDGGRTLLGYTEASPDAEILTNVTDFARDELGYCAWRVI